MTERTKEKIAYKVTKYTGRLLQIILFVAICLDYYWIAVDGYKHLYWLKICVVLIPYLLLVMTVIIHKRVKKSIRLARMRRNIMREVREGRISEEDAELIKDEYLTAMYKAVAK